MLQKTSLTALCIFLMTGCAEAKTPEERGEQKASSVCAACHGIDGQAEMPIYPNLAGQNKPYLEMVLKAYRDGSRTGVQASAMYAVSEQLTDEDIKDLAAYYSSLK